MLNDLFILSISIFLIIKGATMATKYSAQLAENYRLSKYIIGFIIVAVISILPETLISINSAIEGVPEVGLGTLFGSNVADLTLVFAIIIAISGRSISIDSKILKNNIIYPLLLIIPIALGIDGHYSRIEGISLILTGIVFYIMAFKNSVDEEVLEPIKKENRKKNILFLISSMFILLLGSHFIVTSSTDIANYLGINPIFIGIFIIGLGTVIPELIFSLKSVKKDNDSLAVGDILGTVLADATIVVGILSLINPFDFPKKIIYVSGLFMIIASFLLFYFMKSGKTLSKKESFMLLLFWALFIIIEFSINY
ncbi:TPA: sodium:calcium antiporter [Candidatus Nomurabacteria bacterium]|nr:MAG: hypothetical protein O210_OD1C00001G0376 [Parcubacteria bacterium RAAC4_OD1_1]HCY26391.1 sodium:calcium antiporter [Candidatus Nomurabacteria bacterium]